MLSTDQLHILLGLLAILPILVAVPALRIALAAKAHAMTCSSYLAEIAAHSPEHARIAQISAELTELTDAYDALLKSHKKLRSRIGMRENRQKTGNGENADLFSETDKRQLRLAAKSAGLLK